MGFQQSREPVGSDVQLRLSFPDTSHVVQESGKLVGAVGIDDLVGRLEGSAHFVALCVVAARKHVSDELSVVVGQSVVDVVAVGRKGRSAGGEGGTGKVER
jgi:hypothetical protein